MNTKLTYSEKLRDPRWQRRRLEVFQRDFFTCQNCLDKKSTLFVHHKKYTGNPWDAELKDLVTLCEHCHAVVEFCKTNKIPFYIDWLNIKEINAGYAYIIFIGTDSLVSFSMNLDTGVVTLDLVASKNTLRKIIHNTISVWLATGHDHLLVDSKNLIENA
jgi:hypothetical protein